MADVLRGGIAINEVLVDPNSTTNNFDTDGSGAANETDEYIELVNTSSTPIDIGGLQIWDQANDNWFTFPAGTTLAPGGHAMVMTGVQAGGSLPTTGPDDLAFDAGLGGAVINNGGDSIVVYDPAADEYIQATFNGATLDTPESAPAGQYDGFSSTATQVGAGESFGNDIDGFSIQRTPDGAGDFVNGEDPTPAAQNFETSTVCFASGTMIATARGDVCVEDLRPGDLVRTLDHGDQPVRWVFSSRVTAKQLQQTPSLLPVRIKAGKLGGGLPHKDLFVSREHLILVSGEVAKRLFNRDEVLIAAKWLTIDRQCAEIDEACAGVTYTHVMCDNHEILRANGALADSLHLNAASRGVLSDEAWAEIKALFPTIEQVMELGPIPSARLVVLSQHAADLVVAHRNGGTPYLSL